jgi:lipid-binding SYLF domain-containing protein
MQISKIGVRCSILAILVTLAACQTAPTAYKSSRAYELDTQAKASLDKLYAANGKTRDLQTKAIAVLTFPNMIKVGFLGAIQVGVGVLTDMEGRTIGYYNSTAGSFGYQAGIKGFHYSLFLMSKRAIDRLTSAGGLQLGVGPSLVVVKKGFAKGFTTTTLDKDIYAFVYDAQGVFGGAGIEGTKFTRVSP